MRPSHQRQRVAWMLVVVCRQATLPCPGALRGSPPIRPGHLPLAVGLQRADLCAVSPTR
jgi:hypothetical protein